jgi:GTPase involved in cell partitioning and DNA repair
MDNRSPADDYSILLEELTCYDAHLLFNTCIRVINEIDLQSTQENLTVFKQIHKINPIEIFCVTQNDINNSKIYRSTQSVRKSWNRQSSYLAMFVRVIYCQWP